MILQNYLFFQKLKMDTQINSLVYDYLSAISPKVAKKFMEVAKPEALPAGSPKIKEIVSTFNSSAPKRKGENGVVANDAPAAKKAKKDSSDDDSSSDEDEAPAKKVSH